MKKLFYPVLAASMIFAMHFMGACSKDDSKVPGEIPPPLDTEVSVRLSVVAKEMLTRSMDEDSIDDLNIYFFSTKTNYHFYLTQNEPSFEFQILPGSYTIFIAANVHKDMGDMTKVELSQYKYHAESMVEDLPMTAMINVKILGNMTLPTLEVTRAAAKISYSVTVDDAVASTIKLRSIQFCNVPKMTVLFSNAASSTNKIYYDNDAVVAIDNDKTYSGDYYMLDNCQGDVDTITDQKDKSPENAPECATYMRILADGAGKLLEYIVYLGENNTSNFDIKKNTKHTMNLVIKGENEIDNRVTVYEGLYFGKANCYICTGSQVAFDVTPYRTSKNLTYTYSDVYAGAEYEAVKAALLWQDTKNLVRSVSINDNTVIVNTNGGKGNAVVAIYDKTGEILWSFHIWCTDEPKILEFAKNSVGNAYSVLDRNLGATTAALGLHSSYGLFYQWGRKDPFIGALGTSGTDGVTDGKMYNISGGAVSLQREFVNAGGVSIGQLIKTPLVYYYSTNSWVERDPYNVFLWGDNIDDNLQPVKTVYDPCPAGYKVAPYDLLRIASKSGSLTTTNPSGYYVYSSSTINGIAFYYDGKGTDATKIFNMPNNGARNIFGDMALTGAGFWTSGCDTNYNMCYSGWNGFNINNSSVTNANIGYGIRCVKE